MYRFNHKIDMYRKYTPSTEELEEIFIQNDDAYVVPCENCYAILSENSTGQVLVWGCDYFTFLKKIRDNKGATFVFIEVSDETGKRIIQVSTSQFTANKLTSLSKYGIFCDGDDDVREILSQYFFKAIADMPTENNEEVIGFKVDEINDSFIFNGYSADIDNPLKYNNAFNSEEEYIAQLNNLIEETVPMQFVITASAASLLLAYLNLYYKVPVNSFIVNLVGKSTTGKSTAQELGASMMSSLDDTKVISPFFGTQNAVLKALTGKIGICSHYDESTCISSFNKEGWIYSVSNEMDKKRMNSSGSLQTSGTWKTICIISAEEAFMECSDNRHHGLAVRLNVYHNLAYTLSREHAEKIHEFASENYGVIGRMLSDYLIQKDDGEVLDYFNQCRNYLKEKIGSDICNLTERLVNQYSIILVTGELLEEFGLKVDTEKIADIMLEHHKGVTKSTDIAKNAYEVLMNYISRNPYNPGIKIIEKNQEIAIVESLFREILNKGGYRDIKTVVDELDAKKYTKRREKNRKKVKLSVNGNQCYCYLLDATKFGEPDISESEKSIKIQEGEEYDFNPDEEDEI